MRHLSRYRVRAAAVLALVLMATACGSGADRTPEPSRPTPPTRTGLLWRGDVETGDLSQFKNTPQNVTRGGVDPKVIDDPRYVREGRYALAVEISGKETSDNKKGACCDPRSELEPDIGDISPGDDLYFAFSSMLGQDFPVDEDWQVITQWKQKDDGSPPVSIKVKDGRYLLSGGAGHPDGPMPFDEELGAAVPGEWSDWIVHITFSPEPSEGSVEVWRNGSQVLKPFSPEGGTMYPRKKSGDPESYLKTGYYRNGKISEPGTIYFDGWRVGTSRESVAA